MCLFKIVSLHKKNIFAIYYDEKPLTVEQVLQHMFDQNEMFCQTWKTFLCKSSYAYFLLFRPIHNSSYKTDTFMFATVKTSSKHFSTSRKPDSAKYQSYIQKQCSSMKKRTASFKSFSGNTLVIPCPSAKTKNFLYIKTFMRDASLPETHALFRDIARQVYKKLSSHENVYVRTHGLDVPWLHVRIETDAKRSLSHFSVFD